VATITLNIPDEHLDRVVDALCGIGGWTPALGVGRGAFAKQQVAQWIRDQVRQREENVARIQAVANLPTVTPPDVS
jgi:hypothetical protein